MRSKDRLDELRHLARHAGVYHDTVLPEPLGPQDKDVEELLREVEPLRAWVLEVERHTQLMRRLLADPAYSASPQLQEQLDALVTTSNALGLKVCGALRQLQARTGRGERAGGAAARMSRVQLAAWRRAYGDALARQQGALQALHDQQRRLLQEQVKLTNLSLSEEECEHLLESNNIALFVDNLRAETAEARLALRAAEARRDELARVERSLQEVRALFVQLAQLLAAQQEQLDSVEYFALQASEHVESGGQQLLHGTVSRRKTRKKKLGLIICLATGALIVVLVLVVS